MKTYMICMLIGETNYVIYIVYISSSLILRETYKHEHLTTRIYKQLSQILWLLGLYSVR